MGKNIKILIFFLVVVLVLIIFAESNKAKPINWNQTYGLNDKIPFGLKVFNEEAKALFKKQKLEKFSETPYEFFYDIDADNYTNYNENMPPVVLDSAVTTNSDTLANQELNDTIYNQITDTTYYNNDSIIENVAIKNNKKGTIFAVSDFYKFDEKSTEELLYFAEEGNTVFISATTMPDLLKDSLNFNISLRNNAQTYIKNALVNNSSTFYFNKGASDYYFNKFNKNTTKILGNLHDENYILPNFIEIKHGKGKFILHLQPIAFTNYYLLQNNYKYIEFVCSHINTETIFWSVEGIENSSSTDSPLRFIFSQPSLKWAWLLSLFGIFIFVFFNAKRRQRIIPIIEPQKNTTIDFAKTIGNLYFLEKNHKDIAHKKIVYFLEKIRNDFYLETKLLDQTFINRLHQKTSKDKTLIAKTIEKINFVKNSTTLTEKDLIELNTLIENLNLK